jgi:hypothetical protein
LGGSDVAKDKFVVYLLIGQSNMAGMDYAHSDGVTHPKAWNWPLATKKWVPAKEPPNGGKTQGLSGNGEGGPGMPFLKGMAAAYPVRGRQQCQPLGDLQGREYRHERVRAGRVG